MLVASLVAGGRSVGLVICRIICFKSTVLMVDFLLGVPWGNMNKVMRVYEGHSLLKTGVIPDLQIGVIPGISCGILWKLIWVHLPLL